MAPFRMMTSNGSWAWEKKGRRPNKRPNSSASSFDGIIVQPRWQLKAKTFGRKKMNVECGSSHFFCAKMFLPSIVLLDHRPSKFWIGSPGQADRSLREFARGAKWQRHPARAWHCGTPGGR